MGSSGVRPVSIWVSDTGTDSTASTGLGLSEGSVHESLAGFSSLSSCTVSSSNIPMMRLASATTSSVSIPDTSANGAVANDGDPAGVFTPVVRNSCSRSVTDGIIAGFLRVDIDGPELLTVNKIERIPKNRRFRRAILSGKKRNKWGVLRFFFSGNCEESTTGVIDVRRIFRLGVTFRSEDQ